jgi:hypothetical protein
MFRKLRPFMTALSASGAGACCAPVTIAGAASASARQIKEAATRVFMGVSKHPHYRCVEESARLAEE